MTFSICVRESYEDDDGEEQLRFGVAVTTRLPAVGTMCPFVSEHGAVATQSLVNERLGRKGIEYLGDGLRVEDSLQALLNADENAAARQLHGVGRDGEFAFSGEDCKDFYDDRVGENYTVAGNLLTGGEVLTATSEVYEGTKGDDRPLSLRLIAALEAGHKEGGDKREELTIQSAAVRVGRTEEREPEPYYNDLRVDATKTPLGDLRETFEYAKQGYEAALELYGDAYEEDDMSAAED